MRGKGGRKGGREREREREGKETEGGERDTDRERKGGNNAGKTKCHLFTIFFLISGLVFPVCTLITNPKR